MKSPIKRFSIISALAITLLIAGCSGHSANFESNFQTVKSYDNSEIAYEILGSGNPTLVFVHGWTGDHSVWDHQVEHFADSRQVVRLDLAGRGKSGSERNTYTIRAYGQDVASVVNNIGTDDVILVGHSMGGPVVVEAANILGDKVKGIVVVDNFHTPLFAIPEAPKLNMLNNLKNNYDSKFKSMVTPMFTQSAAPETVEAVTDKMASVDKDVSTSSLYECIIWNSREAEHNLKKYNGIIYNINADPEGKAVSMRDDVILIPEVGHFVQIVKPEEFNAALENYLNHLQ